MQKNVLFITILLLVATYQLSAQHISEFSSSTPGDQDTDFHLPATHSFQYIIEHGDPLTEGETLPKNCDPQVSLIIKNQIIVSSSPWLNK